MLYEKNISLLREKKFFSLFENLAEKAVKAAELLVVSKEDYEGNPLDRAYVVERRDELWEAISQNGKVVAVFFGDEHNYNRMSIDSETPVHLDGSANANFNNPVWQIISGGAGAPFYAQEDTPWSGDVEVFYPSKHYCMVSVDGDKVSLKTISDSGEIVDECVLCG